MITSSGSNVCVLKLINWSSIYFSPLKEVIAIEIIYILNKHNS